MPLTFVQLAKRAAFRMWSWQMLHRQHWLAVTQKKPLNRFLDEACQKILGRKP